MGRVGRRAKAERGGGVGIGGSGEDMDALLALLLAWKNV